MASDPANTEGMTPTGSSNTPVPLESPGTRDLTVSPSADSALTALSSIASSVGSPEYASTRAAGEFGTVAQTSAGPRTSAAPRPAARLPRYLGEYQLLEEIARAGMGIVYRARQEKLNRPVAVKLIKAGSLAGIDEVRRFRHEAEAMATLDHPNIIPIYEIGQEDDLPYFSMKLIEQGNLTAHIERLKDDPPAVAALMAKVARAVHYAHQRAILHRDIKPSNILVG